jgi:DNA-binding CsgD family transcriptional regulator
MAEQIVGRRGELVALAEFVGGLPAGGSALLFEGDAGIGKTALWQEGTRLAREGGVRVLTARATESELQTSFATVTDLFAPALKDTLPRLVPLQRLALEVAFLIREPDGPPPEGRLLAAALHSVVRILVEDGPLLVAIDDAQSVDASSAEALRFVLRRLESEPVGVLATVRGRPVEAPLGLERAFPGFRRLPVMALSVGAIHRLLWGRLSLSLPRPVLVRVHEVVGGNPFFALEVGRALVDGTIRADGVHGLVPESLRALVAGRVSALPVGVRETLTAVAALGAPSVTLLEPLSPTAVAEIELACQRRIIELDGDRIRFTHPLLAPVCYEDMPLHRRRRLHSRLADLDVDPEEGARHLAIAAAGPDEEIAAALDAAAIHAYERGAAQAAAELAERAIALTPSEALDRVNERRSTAAWRCYEAGDLHKSLLLLEEAVGSSTPGPARADMLFQLAMARGETDGKRTAAEILGRAIAEPGLESVQRVRMLCQRAELVSSFGSFRDAVVEAEAGLELAEELGVADLLAFALYVVTSLWFMSEGRIREDLIARAIELERTADAGRHTPGYYGTARLTVPYLLGRSGRYDDARLRFHALIVEATEHADPQVPDLLYLLARMEVAAGRWDEAARLCEESMEVARQVGYELMGSTCLTVLAEIDVCRGEVEKARRELPALLRIAERAGLNTPTHDLLRAHALLELSCGDPEASWRQVAPRFGSIDQLHENLAHLAASVAIEALIATGDLSAADRLLTLLDDYVAQADTGHRPLALRCRGLLLAAQGDDDGAVAALQAAAADPEPPQGVNPFELARTLLALGTVQRKSRHKRAARESLQRAVEIFEQLRARLWLEIARSELRRIGGRIPTEGELSETERRIVELVIAGRRNREVADELSLSPNTVAWNLSKVYRKLGVTSRTELAAHVAAMPPA